MGPVVDIANSSSNQFSVSKMERNHKRRGFMKSIFSLAAAKPSAPAQCSSKVKPSPPTQSAHVGQAFYKEEISVKNPSLIVSKTGTFSEAKPVAGRFHGSSSTTGLVFDCHTDYGGDEDVDMKAANYISNVRERFKLVNVDLDHRMR